FLDGQIDDSPRDLEAEHALVRLDVARDLDRSHRLPAIEEVKDHHGESGRDDGDGTGQGEGLLHWAFWRLRFASGKHQELCRYRALCRLGSASKCRIFQGRWSIWAVSFGHTRVLPRPGAGGAPREDGKGHNRQDSPMGE